MDDAFAIQSEIAGKVAGVLQAKLAMAPAAAEKPLDPDAYSAALVARAQVRSLGLEELTAARKTYARLIDNGDVDASVLAGYAQSTMLLAQNYLALDFNKADAESKAAIDRALALNPRSSEAYVARGMRCVIRTIRMADQACVAEAGQAYAAAARLAPRDPDVLTGYANFLIKRRQPDEAQGLLQRATTIDPLNRVALMLLAGTSANLGRYDEAERRYRSVVELFPDFVDAKQELGGTLVEEGKLDEAEPWLRAAAAPGTDPSASLELANLYLNLGMTDRYNATLAAMTAPPVAPKIAEAIRKVAAADYAGALAFVEARYAEDHDPVWASAIGDLALMSGDLEKARRVGLQMAPDLFAPDPVVDSSMAHEAVSAAYVLDRMGDRAQARRVLAAMLAATAPRPGVRQSHRVALPRVGALAMLGQKEQALAEFKTAVAQGYRNLWDIDVWIRLDAYPELAPLKDDPRFQALIRQIETDNARMRGLVQARS
ncbi:MAG TPA: tetratricopeptide repeat protein, partial [Caulobacteraceae bacterium]|nr:tetratricopeptide repeat protein [Caulobacteraceae bacterium]